MRIEFHEDCSCHGNIIARHASNGAILGTGRDERSALASVIYSAYKALIEIDDRKPLNERDQRVADQLFDAASSLRINS